MKRIRNFIPLFALFLAVLACSLSVDLGEQSEEVVEPEVTEEVVLPEEQELPEAEELPKESEQAEKEAYLCPLDLVAAVYPEIQLCYPPTVVSAISPSIYDENPPAEDEVWLFMVHPRMIHVSPEDYVRARSGFPAFMRVYPVKAYIDMDPFVGGLVSELEGLLATQDPSPDYIKFVPYQNASQQMVAKVNYLSFRNGHGMRFITQDAQDTLPINNQEAYYAFLGLTEDGQYLVSAVLPISSPLFYPDTESLTDEDWETLWVGYDDYIAELKDALAGELLESFEPSLTILDAMMSSLLVPPGILD